MSINALVHCLRGLCRHVLPRNASVVWASLTEVASSSSFLIPHDRQDPGKIYYSGPVLYFMVKSVLNSQKSGFLSGIRFLYSPAKY